MKSQSVIVRQLDHHFPVQPPFSRVQPPFLHGLSIFPSVFPRYPVISVISGPPNVAAARCNPPGTSFWLMDYENSWEMSWEMSISDRNGEITSTSNQGKSGEIYMNIWGKHGILDGISNSYGYIDWLVVHLSL